ncbi:alpha/beta fold hydrolase [Nitrospirillum iridis]|uniref:Pimeloyl-ACP methyl ester carboxylesterase n=1 Tax=Nitrospirillum iridis TaxID=765888 RepID=A0A7X0ECF3_9PROT|nr:alpha/beta fold hydrolase [Nitrospirillum iridis]MBB6251055.1 pimeloyl-ACP methyl ester carboxylesterase [Nitrospirillum iridis]
MTADAVGRRQMLAGIAVAGFAASVQPSAAAGTTPPSATPGDVRQDMASCRFGVIHYRFVKPATPTGKVPVLCLHASPGSGVGFSRFLPILGTDRMVIAADNPGFGLSDRPPQPSTIADFAGAMADLLDALQLTRVDLVGSHTGSATAVELARQRPRAVRRIVLHAAPLFTPQEIADYKSRLAADHPGSLDEAAAKLPEVWAKFGRMRQDLGDDLAWQLFWEMNRDPLHRGWGHDAAFAYDYAGGLRQVTQPTLVLNPQEAMSAVTARARGVASNIQVMDLPWSGGLFSGHAEDVAPLIRAHLDA